MTMFKEAEQEVKRAKRIEALTTEHAAISAQRNELNKYCRHGFPFNSITLSSDRISIDAFSLKPKLEIKIPAEDINENSRIQEQIIGLNAMILSALEVRQIKIENELATLLNKDQK